MAQFHVLANDEGIEVRCESEGQVGGLIASVGSRLIEAVGKKMLNEYFRKLGQHIGG
jgi:carbon monoxide dehydrogenase subunit G